MVDDVKNNVHAWPKPAGRAEAEVPKPLVRPCDYSLLSAINALDTQLGTIEAYNRLATASAAMKAKIDAGQAKAQNPMFAVSTGASPYA